MFEGIQRLRGAAVLMVLVGHATFFIDGMAGEYPILKYFRLMQRTGVDVFFVISGFVICNNLLKIIKTDKAKNFISNLELNIIPLKSFFMRRIYRLFPNIFLFFLFCVIYYSIFYSYYKIQESIIAFLSYISLRSDYDSMAFSALNVASRNGGHFWSLVSEERFYLFFPFILILLKSYKNAAIFSIITIFLIPIVCLCFNIDFSIAYHNGFLRFDAFAYGILLSLAFTQTNLLNLILNGRKNYLTINLITIILFIILLRNEITVVKETGESLAYSNPYFNSMTSFISCILIFLAVKDKNYIFGIPGIKNFLNWAGDRSYTLYVFHILCLNFIAPPIWDKIDSFGLTSSPIIKFSIYIFITFVLCEVIYKFYEYPLRNLGRKISKRRYDNVTALNAHPISSAA